MLRREIGVRLRALLRKVDQKELDDQTLKTIGLFCIAVTHGMEIEVKVGTQSGGLKPIEGEDHLQLLQNYSDEELFVEVVKMLPGRAKNAVNRLVGENKQISQLIRMTEQRVLAEKNVGDETYSRIERALDKFGLRFDTPIEEVERLFPGSTKEGE